MPNFKHELAGKKFGRVSVIKQNGKKHGGIMWDCQCDCGKLFNTRGQFLVNGETRSCGCLARERRIESIQLPKGEAALNKIIYEYKYGAKKRGLSFELTREECRSLFSGNCYYCGVEPRQHFSGKWSEAYNGLFYYNGIDRVDNNAGYLKGNSVSCCSICNRAKHAMTTKDYCLWLDRLVQYRSKIS